MPDRSPTPVILFLTLSNLTMVGFALALSQWGFDPTNLFALLVIPIGAIIFGLLGSLGAIPGMRLANYPAGPQLRIFMTAGAVLALALYVVLQGAMLSWSHPAHPGLLDAIAGRATAGGYVARRGSNILFQADHLGSWGYAFLALKFVGAAVGAWTHHAVLALMPYCRPCGVFTERRDKAELLFKKAEAWTSAMAAAPDAADERAAYLLALPRRGMWTAPGNHFVIMRLLRSECPQCGKQHMREQVFTRGGEAKQYRLRYSWSRRKTPQPSGQGNAPAVRSFGRKIA